MTRRKRGPDFLYDCGRARRVLKKLPDPFFYYLNLEEADNA
jgi:hypothetical protein